MSLLLEALKKAELAKQALQQGQDASETTLPLGTSTTASGVDLPTGDATASGPLDLSTTQQGRAGDTPIITRNQLPRIDQALELIPDSTLDIGAAETTNPNKSSLDLRLDETLPPTPAARLSATTAAAAAAGAATVAAATTLGGRGPARVEARNDTRETTQPNKPWLAPAEDRNAARQVFQAKGLDYNPRRPFYLTLGALGTAFLAAGVYFWWQMQPASNFRASPQPAVPAQTVAQSAAPAPAPIASTPIAVAPVAPPPAVATPIISPTTTPSVAPPMVVVPDLSVPPVAAKPVPTVAAVTPPAAIAPTPTGAPAQRVITTFERVPVPPQPAGIARVAPIALTPMIRRDSAAETAPRTAGASAPVVPITVQRSVRQVEPAVERGYSAFQAGNLELARQEYLAALRSDSFNRDALLGLAAIDVQTQNYEGAELRYQRVLESDPRDQHAQAALISLRGHIDPLQSESRTKNLIAQQPDSAPLQFTLGNQLAAQGRWTEAQAAYFKAFSGDPDNADYAFNLAVSLDQIRQRKPALEYYQRALNLARSRQAVFDRNQVSARVAELQK